MFLGSTVHLFIFYENIIGCFNKNIAFYLQTLSGSSLLMVMAKTSPQHFPWLFYSIANNIKLLI